MDLDPQTGDLVLKPGDAVDDIPASHRAMLTDTARELFSDSRAYFTRLAAACPFPHMAHWLRSVAADRRGELHLYPRHPGGKTGWSGYLAQPVGMYPVLYHPPLDQGDYDLGTAPADLRAYYRLVNTLRWGYPGRGGLKGVFDVMPLELADDFSPRATGLDGESTWDWGSTGSGDTFWYTDDGRAGRLRWEGSLVEPLGSIADAIDWVFARINAGQSPS